MNRRAEGFPKAVPQSLVDAGDSAHQNAAARVTVEALPPELLVNELGVDRASYY